MAQQGWVMNARDLLSDPARYEVDDLTVDLAPRRVRRAGTVIRLQALSFDLLVTLVRAAPGLVSFEQLSERVWPGLVVTPETVVQRVKLLRSALGDDAHAPRYIEGVRGRGYRMVADVRPLMEGQGVPESVVPPPNAHGGVAVSGAAVVSFPSAAPHAARIRADWILLGRIGGTLIIAVLLAASWAALHFRGMSESAGQTSSATAPAAIRSLAVLPLESLSGDREQEYFADGMTDALTTDLAQIGSLRVISRNSAMHFKASTETLPQIGHDLHVDAVVEGAVTRSADRVRVTAQLVATASDRHLWARTYERDLKDVLVLQDEIAQDIAEQIRVKLTPKERSLLIEVHAVDPEAHDDYLRGRYWAYKQTLEGGQKALEYYRKAIAKDPSYALAYAGLAEAYYVEMAAGGLSLKEASPRVIAAANKALVLDPSLAEPRSYLALIRLFSDWDWSGADAEFKQSIALNPNFAEAHQGYAIYLIVMNRLDEAVNESERAVDLDPFNLWSNRWLGQALYHARRYDDALRQIRRTLGLFPDVGVLYNDMADVYEQKRMFAEAFAARQQALALDKNPSVTALRKAYDRVYERAGYRGYLLEEIRVMERGPRQECDFAVLAHLYAMLDDQAHAVSSVERAYEEHSPEILFAGTAPELDSIRSSPRFEDVLRRIGLPQPTGQLRGSAMWQVPNRVPNAGRRERGDSEVLANSSSY